jgi:hypothetical protein
MLWELPPPEAAAAHAPTRCEERPFLTPAPPDTPASERGGASCEVPQHALQSEADAAARERGARGRWGEQGFYFDDFSDARYLWCAHPRTHAFLFTEFAQPPRGVTVRLDCHAFEALHDASAEQAVACRPSL